LRICVAARLFQTLNSLTGGCLLSVKAGGVLLAFYIPYCAAVQSSNYIYFCAFCSQILKHFIFLSVGHVSKAPPASVAALSIILCRFSKTRILPTS